MKRQTATREHDLTEFEAADRLGLSTRTLQRLRARGEGPPFFKYGSGRTSAVRYGVAELEAWRQAHRRTSTSDTRE